MYFPHTKPFTKDPSHRVSPWPIWHHNDVWCRVSGFESRCRMVGKKVCFLFSLSCLTNLNLGGRSPLKKILKRFNIDLCGFQSHHVNGHNFIQWLAHSMCAFHLLIESCSTVSLLFKIKTRPNFEKHIVTWFWDFSVIPKIRHNLCLPSSLLT